MARRANHGRRLDAGSLALAQVAGIVPPQRLRLTRIQIAWDDVAPPTVRDRAWPTKLQDRCLWLAVLDNQWLHELSYLQEELLTQLRGHIGDIEIDALRLRVGSLPDRPPAPPPPPNPSVPPLPDEPSQETLQALRAVHDPSLRQTMANARLALSHRVRHR